MLIFIHKLIHIHTFRFFISIFLNMFFFGNIQSVIKKKKKTNRKIVCAKTIQQEFVGGCCCLNLNVQEIK